MGIFSELRDRRDPSSFEDVEFFERVLSRADVYERSRAGFYENRIVFRGERAQINSVAIFELIDDRDRTFRHQNFAPGARRVRRIARDGDFEVSASFRIRGNDLSAFDEERLQIVQNLCAVNHQVPVSRSLNVRADDRVNVIFGRRSRGNRSRVNRRVIKRIRAELDGRRRRQNIVHDGNAVGRAERNRRYVRKDVGENRRRIRAVFVDRVAEQIVDGREHRRVIQDFGDRRRIRRKRSVVVLGVLSFEIRLIQNGDFSARKINAARSRENPDGRVRRVRRRVNYEPQRRILVAPELDCRLRACDDVYQKIQRAKQLRVFGRRVARIAVVEIRVAQILCRRSERNRCRAV